MTCKEFLKLAGTDPRNDTVAEMGAFFQHAMNCDPCCEHLESMAKNFMSNASLELIERADRIGEECARRILNDPEAIP